MDRCAQRFTAVISSRIDKPDVVKESMQLQWFVCLLYLVQRVIGNTSTFQQFSFNEEELRHYREDARELFYHAYDHYLEMGFPYDEVYPIKCRPRTRNFGNALDHHTNDVLGNFSASLVDSMTTLAVLGDVPRFREAIALVELAIPEDFAIDSTVQVFETTIRILGGLLSAHLYATDPTRKVYLGGEYNGVLLQRAQRLADRLLPAYRTKSGLPLPRMNLARGVRGVPVGLLQENNAAAMACPMLEFTLLSYLTHNHTYADVARYAFDKVWSMRSELDLLPMSYNPQNGMVFAPYTGIGASIDSFYEYALKGAILFNDDELWKTWEIAYYALRKHARADWFYVNVATETGRVVLPWIDSLSAFFPGLQVLAGDIQDAKLKHLMFLKQWNTYRGLPERWEFQKASPPVNGHDEASGILLSWYPLRPEFIESTYYLYRATKDVFYLKIAWSILQDLKTFYKTPCGFAGVQDIITGQRQDRMETFVLSETLKYLYLIFDVHNELHTDSRNVIFSTEAHPLWLGASDFASNQEMRNRYDISKGPEITNFQNYHSPEERSMFNDIINGFLEIILPASNSSSTRSSWLTSSALDSRNSSLASQTCARTTQKSRHFLYSPMLAEFPRLFEIDYRYASTLTHPPRLINNQQMEIEPRFYELWSGSSRSQQRDDNIFCISALPPTTETFEMIFDVTLNKVPGQTPRVLQVPLANGRIPHKIELQVLAGIRMRIEVLRPNSIDADGHKVETAIFKDIPRDDINAEPAAGKCDAGAPLKSADDAMQLENLLYRAIAVEGERLPPGGIVTISKLPTFDLDKVDSGSLGYNDRKMLLLDGVPLVNVIVDDG